MNRSGAGKAAGITLKGAQGRYLYKQITRRKYLVLTALFLMLITTLLLDISLGPARLSLGEVMAAIVKPNSSDPLNQVIVWDIRMPMALMAIIVGAALAVAGAEM